jgi:hypothetical protein
MKNKNLKKIEKKESNFYIFDLAWKNN